MSEKNRFHIFIFYTVSFAIMLYILLALMPGNMDYLTYEPDFQRSFSLQINGKNYPDISFEEWSSIRLHPQDIVVLTATLPKDTPSAARLHFKSLYSSIEVLVDGSRIYAHGIEQQQSGHPLGCGYHSIKLPKNYQGKKLSLKLSPSHPGKLPYLLRNISLGENRHIVVSIVRQNMIPFLTTIFLITFGIILFVLFLIFYLMNLENMFGLIYLSFFTFSIGLWGLSGINFIQIFSDDIFRNTYIEYFAFYSIFPSWIFVFSDLKRHHRFKKHLCLLQAFFVFFIAVVALLQMFHIKNYDHFLSLYQLLCFIALLFIIFLLLHQFRTQPLHEKILCIGSLGVVIIVTTQIVLYNITRNFSISIPYAQNALLYVNMLIVVCVLIISYSIRFFDSVTDKRELQLLEKMAYHDSLTGLGNRQQAIIQLKKYQQLRQHYHLIIFDLNNLKTANDSFGHARGDQMIRDFARCLQQAFGDEGTIHRIGGDEFLVTLPTTDGTYVDQKIQSLYTILEEENQRYTDNVLLTTAYGSSSSIEFQSFDYDLILKTADDRMYSHKHLMKKDSLT